MSDIKRCPKHHIALVPAIAIKTWTTRRACFTFYGTPAKEGEVLLYLPSNTDVKAAVCRCLKCSRCGYSEESS